MLHFPFLKCNTTVVTSFTISFTEHAIISTSAQFGLYVDRSCNTVLLTDYSKWYFYELLHCNTRFHIQSFLIIRDMFVYEESRKWNKIY